MKSLSKNLKNKNAAFAVAMFLMVAIVVSLVVIPMGTALTGVGWEVSITGSLSGTFQSYIYYDGAQQGYFNIGAWTGAYLAVKAPSATEWTEIGPYSMSGYYRRFSATYTSFTEWGVYQFRWIVPPQESMPPNPTTADGRYYSDILELTSGGSLYIALQSINRAASTGVIRGEMRINDARTQTAFTNVELRARTPGGAWTSVGLFNTTNGRIDITYNFTTLGTYEFQYIMDPQGSFPTNPDSADGRWYSDILSVPWNWEIYISVPTSTAYPNIALSPVRMEARFAGYLQSITLSNVVLNVKYPNGTLAAYQGPWLTTSGRVDVSFTTVVNGTHEFQFIVSPEGDLPTNPATTDGKWYSDVATKNVVKVVYPTFAFIGALPNPVGVGQTVLLHVGITYQLNLDGMQWEGITVEVTRPDNETEILGPYKSDSTGGTGATLIPTMAGNYTVRTHFPEQQNLPTRYGMRGSGFGQAMAQGTYVGESYSRNLTVVVQEEQVPYYPWYEPPTEYWTRPIDAQIREWGKIAGSSFDPDYQDAPESAHVLWAKRLGVEGITGGTVDTRETYSSRIILAGILLYSTDTVDVQQYYVGQNTTGYTVAVDVRTGEELWRQANMTMSWGQIYYHDSMNRHCSYAYAWTIDETTRKAICYDPWSGYLDYTINDFPEGPMSFGSIGEMMVYHINFTERYMHVWNSSWQYMEGKTSMNMAFNVLRQTYNSLPKFAANRGWQNNITIPAGLTGEVREVVWSERVVGVDIQGGVSREWAFSLVPGHEGELLWDRTVNFALPNVSPATVEGPMFVEGNITDHVQLRYQESTGKYWAFSLDNGALLWKSEDFTETAVGENALNLAGRSTKIAYGMIYASGSSGMVYAYDFHTGLNWTYSVWEDASAVAGDSIYWSGVALISDGKVYVGNGESAGSFVCLDAFTGDVIWQADGMFRQAFGGSNVFIGDSVIVTLDTLDQRVYAVGKGPSAITVTAPDVSVPFDTPVTVRGRVTDVSPGTWDSGLGTYRNVVNISTWDSAMKLRFPDGVPAVGDESMSDWMKYVYKNLPLPADVVGVEVVVSVLDSNNNYYEVGRTVADSNGVFALEFVPLIEGKYLVVAEFEGSESYYGSAAETTIVVETPVPAAPEPTATPVSVADAYFVPAIAGIIVAIVVLGALMALLILRKR